MEDVPLKPLISLAVGFLGMTAAISVYSILALIHGGDSELGLLYFMILAIPTSFGIYTWHKQTISGSKSSFAEKLAGILFAMEGVALACWTYDLASTFYAINVARVATEVNPLGWPLGAIGALSYYAPTVILTYVLLFRLKAKISLYAAVPVAFVALIMGSMNLVAGAENFTFFIWTTSLSASVRNNLIALIAAVDLAYVAALTIGSRKRIFRTQKLSVRN